MFEKVKQEDVESFNEAVKKLDNVLCNIQEKYGDKVMMISYEDAIALTDCREQKAKELSVVYTKGIRDIDEATINIVNPEEYDGCLDEGK